MDPFTYAKAEKKAVVEKQNLASLKNKINQTAPSKMKNSKVQVLEKRKGSKVDEDAIAKKTADNAQLRSDEERTALRKREHKALMKSLSHAQMATGSMGKFDKKMKNEPDAPKSLKVVPKKSNKHLGELETNRGAEQERNAKIFKMMEKKADIGGLSVGEHSKISSAGESNAKKAKKTTVGKNRRPSSKGPKRGVADQGKKHIKKAPTGSGKKESKV